MPGPAGAGGGGDHARHRAHGLRLGRASTASTGPRSGTGTYTLPGGQLLTDGRTGPAEIVGPREYTIAPARPSSWSSTPTWWSRISPTFGFPKGLTAQIHVHVRLRPADPTSTATRQRNVANWADFTGTGGFFVPFLNEGLLMTNVRLRDYRSENDPMMMAAAGFVRDTRPFFDTRFSCREPRRFVGIALDQVMAGYSVGHTDITRNCRRLKKGDPHATEKLLPLVYDELAGCDRRTAKSWSSSLPPCPGSSATPSRTRGCIPGPPPIGEHFEPEPANCQ